MNIDHLPNQWIRTGLGCIVAVALATSGASAQTDVSASESQIRGKLTGLTYKLNHPVIKMQELLLYPNPASSDVEVKLPKTAILNPDYAGFYISVLNQNGMPVIQKPWKGEDLDVSDLASGLYVVVVNKDRYTYTQKLVIEK